MDVAELVPVIALGEGGSVAAFEELPAGDGFHEEEVAGLGFVPAADDAVDPAVVMVQAGELCRFLGDQFALAIQPRSADVRLDEAGARSPRGV